jgi:two-component system, chemotaxis family, sensor histidine kinase and response regulator PixL
MTDDLDFQESLDRYFEIEAAELLQTIEQTLFQLVEEKTIERVHTLMRSAHTIKGSAANCGFKTIETIAHHLEDVFQALYPAELEIDAELGLLLVEGYECLSDPLSAMLAGIPYDEAATLERTAELFARLQTHLGDFFGRDTPLPTAADLGFDVVGSIFTDSVPQDLEVLATAIAGQNVDKVRESLSSLAEFLLELGGSYSLPGIEIVARTTLTALQRNPDKVLEIAQAALTNFQQAQIAIVGGDRSVGGEVSSALIAWAETDRSVVAQPLESRLDRNDAAEWMSLVDSNSLESDAPISDDRASSEDWLSLIDRSDAVATPTVDENSQTSEDWLSLMETDRVEPDTTTIATAPQVDENSQTAEDWLSIVEPNHDRAELETDRSASDNLVETVDLEPEVVEFEVFEPEVINLNTSELVQTEYFVEQNEQQTGANLVLANISGIDRIFQSISIGHSSSFADDNVSEAETAPARETKESAPDALVSIRIATVQLERLSHTMGELLIDDNQQYLRTEQLHRLAKSTVEQHRRCEQKLRLVGDWADKNTLTGDRPQFSQHRGRKAKKAAKKVANEVQSQFDSIELDVYNDLSILLQDLTDDLANLGMQVEDLAEMTQKAKLTLGKRKQLLVDAQAELFDARMVEISTVFNRFPRLLQQMVASHRKPAQLELLGTTVSIDKIIADKLYDPLLHLIRNAYDHGVEPPEIRAQQGKSETGKLTIKAYHQGNRTTIEVSDDGQGLNFTKIRQRAIDLHLLEAHRASSVTEAELSEIMFAPGFSTADRVNDLSGRGIGLDVVRDRIGALQGTIDVRSISGRGTTFILQFPLNLTTARLLICESQGVVHALRSEAIGQVLLPSPDRIQSQSSLTDRRVTNFFRWGEGSTQKLIPIYPINRLLDYHCPTISGSASVENLFPANIKNSTSALLLLEIDDDRICLEVNRILVEQELVVKSLGQTFGLPNYIQGYSVLGDGSLTLAIDPIELLAPVRNTRATPKFGTSPLAALQPLLRAALGPAEDPIIEGEILDTSERTPARNSTMLGKQIQVLIVDDSLVQRQTLTRALTKAGCQVIQASHGREGILRLQEHPRIRLVVCDIEMPQMNGFEFLSHCRQDPKLAQIPIVMLTTRGGQKHRQLAMTLGAKDYLTKPQSERDLLDIVAKLSQPNEVRV